MTSGGAREDFLGQEVEGPVARKEGSAQSKATSQGKGLHNPARKDLRSKRGHRKKHQYTLSRWNRTEPSGTLEKQRVSANQSADDHLGGSSVSGAPASSHRRPETPLDDSAISYDYSEEQLMASIEREYCR
ncbi:cystin-1 [Suricata suricatta]|uniref:cystin-1 n=1 Tax=Suricata suricatta TaxID=37032 RepID=UPI001155DFA2|nr:cystin-1 [Suricata suricatta]